MNPGEFKKNLHRELKDATKSEDLMRKSELEMLLSLSPMSQNLFGRSLSIVDVYIIHYKSG